MIRTARTAAKISTRSAAVCVLLLAALISGCTTVRFNQRERLAQPDMQFDADPLQAQIESHVLQSRQGSSGNFATGGGGGCGCY